MTTAALLILAAQSTAAFAIPSCDESLAKSLGAAVLDKGLPSVFAVVSSGEG